MATRFLSASALLVLTLAACSSKDGGRNSVWLAVSNESGRTVSGLSLSCGKTDLRASSLASGSTEAGWARVSEPQSVALSYTDADGVRRAPELGAPVEPKLIGGRVLLTIQADGTVVRLDEPYRGPPRSLSMRADDFLQDNAVWLGALLAALVLPPLILFLRKAKSAAGEAGARLKDAAAKVAAAAAAPEVPEPPRDRAILTSVQTAAAAALGLSRKPCPIPMYSSGANPSFWHEGTLDGVMFGLGDHGSLWLGGVDEETLVDFSRSKDSSAFQGTDYADGRAGFLLTDAEIPRILARFSPAVREVHVLADAVEALFDWGGASAESAAADARVLRELSARVESLDAPLVHAARRGDAAKVQALIRAGADLKILSMAGDGAMGAAARGGHLEVVRLLLEAGLPVDQRDEAMGTALHDAAHRGGEEVVAYLLAKGADPGALNRNGKSALYFARAGGYERIAELLLKAGAKS